MKLLALLLSLTLCLPAFAGRLWNQQECRSLALIAGQAAAYRDNKVPLPEVLKALREAADHPEQGKSILRFPGDYELIESLVQAVWKSSMPPQIAFRVVWSRCDRLGASKYVKEVRHVD